MPRKLRYFAVTGAFTLIVLFAVSSNYSRIVYFNDTVKSLVIRTFGLYGSSSDAVSVISSDKFKKYRKTYKGLPEGALHFGKFLLYRAPVNISVSKLAYELIEYTNFYKLYDLRNSINSLNRISGGIVNRGEIVYIARSLPPIVSDDVINRTGRIISTRGLYLTGESAGSRNFTENIAKMKSRGINAIVFDVKDITGILHTRSSLEPVRRYNLGRLGAINNLPRLVRECRSRGIYTIARIAVFRDHLLYNASPGSRIKSKSTGKDWNPASKEKWCDPTNKNVQDYNIGLAVEMAKAGVDEVQFDYIRFPTVGDVNDADYVFDFGRMSRVEAVAQFLRRAYRELSARGTFLSIDIFGVVAWGKKVDIVKTGQQIAMLAPYCDVISPMLYPSHFNDNFDGFSKPGDHPYHFILQGCKKVLELSARKVLVRPWLQAFTWRVSHYNASYIAEQIRASDDSGSFGYLFWNASNRYDEVYQALDVIRASAVKK